jgi:hypothetical protein
MLALAILLPVLALVIACCVKIEKTYREALRKLWKGSHPTCSAMEAACRYSGWYGSVHTFYFHNSRFAEAFRDANPGKCLDAPL